MYVGESGPRGRPVLELFNSSKTNREYEDPFSTSRMRMRPRTKEYVFQENTSQCSLYVYEVQYYYGWRKPCTTPCTFYPGAMDWGSCLVQNILQLPESLTLNPSTILHGGLGVFLFLWDRVPHAQEVAKALARTGNLPGLEGI